MGCRVKPANDGLASNHDGFLRNNARLIVIRSVLNSM